MIVDFSHVPSNQYEIHDRLLNWAKWARGGNSRNVHPMFRQYRNDYWEPTPSVTYADTVDALAVQKTMTHIPERYRLAVQWFYIARSNPMPVCRHLGVSKQGLADLVIDGRTMVKDQLKAKDAQTA